MTVDHAAVWALSDAPTLDCIQGYSCSQYSMEAQLADLMRGDFSESPFPEPDKYARAVSHVTHDFGRLKSKALSFETDLRKVNYKKGTSAGWGYFDKEGRILHKDETTHNRLQVLL